MPNYKKLYHKAFNAMTDAERLIERAAIILRATQQDCEEAYLSSDDATPEEAEQPYA